MNGILERQLEPTVPAASQKKLRSLLDVTNGTNSNDDGAAAKLRGKLRGACGLTDDGAESVLCLAPAAPGPNVRTSAGEIRLPSYCGPSAEPAVGPSFGTVVRRLPSRE